MRLIISNGTKPLPRTAFVTPLATSFVLRCVGCVTCCTSLNLPLARYADVRLHIPMTHNHGRPSQAVYYNNVLVAIAASKGHCLDTRVAAEQIDFLNVVSNSTPWWYNWYSFQPQYYDMPRVPGASKSHYPTG